MRILVMESSTSSAKAMLYSTQNGVEAVRSQQYVPKKVEAGEVGAQVPEQVFLHTVAVAKKLAEGRTIDAIVPCSTWHNVMVADREMRPCSPAYTWSYNGAAAVAGRLRKDREFCHRFYQRTGCMVHAIYPAFKLLMLREGGMKLHHKQICSQGSYNVFRLTGERVTTDCSASGSGLLNIHTRRWDQEILQMLGLKEEQLCDLSDYKHPIPLSSEGSRLLGQPAGTPVLPCYPDGALNQVGAGALLPGMMTFSIGTSGAIRLSVEHPVLPEEPSTWCYLSPNGWLSGAATSGACNCLEWCKSTFFPGEKSFARLDEVQVDLKKMPLFFPFLFGERCPGWNDEWRGGFAKLRPFHKAVDLYRSVQEGIIFNLYQCYQILCAENGVPKQIQLSGGVINSRVWRQMCCDIFGRELLCADTSQASMLGGAVLALETLGYIRSIEEFETGVAQWLEPDPVKHQMYEERFQMYLDHYQAGNF